MDADDNAGMKLLALDTATEACSAALWLDGEVEARFEIVGRDHTQRLIPVVAGLLAEAGLCFSQLDGLVCGVGPGSFAGVRIGVAFAKGVALAHELPVVGVSSLALLAQAALAAPGTDSVLAAIDARMGEVYFQAFVRDASGLAQPASEAVVCAPSAARAPAQGAAWQAVGSGWATYQAELCAAVAAEISGFEGAALPQAAHGFALAVPCFERGQAGSADALQPIYLRNRVALTLVEQQQLRAKTAQGR